MPTFYNFAQDGLTYRFDDIFVPADYFTDGDLWTWGTGTSGQLGNNAATNRQTPVTTFAGGNNWKQVSCGNGFTAAIKTDGTLWVWGAGANGRLGNNDTSIISTPVTTFAGGTNWKQISCRNFAVAVKTGGTLWTWGQGANAELGTNDTANRSTPVTTFAGGTNWKQSSCGESFAAAIKTDGTLWLWGQGSNGQLGNNQNLGIRSTPVTTFAGGNNWKQVSCGNAHTLAIKTDGTLWAWGSGARLGINNSISRSTPITTFAGGNDWKQVSCGSNHTAAIKNDGSLWVWGTGSSGQLGANNTNFRLTPVTTFAGGNNWKQVSCGYASTLAIKTDGTLWVWGNGGNGELGINAFAGSLTPVTTFAGGSNWKQVDCGVNLSSATTYDTELI